LTYLSQADVESTGGGYCYSDFKQSGNIMTPAQWQIYCGELIAAIDSAINHYCRVASFELNTYTELHDGRGGTDELGGYRERDRIYLIRQQPVVSLISVSEDFTSPFGPITWTPRIQRTTSTTWADFELCYRGDTLAYLYFWNHVPRKGRNNIQFIYTAGYAVGSEILNDIQFIAMQIADNLLGRKKRYQEANAARQSSTKDATEMFRMDANGAIFTEDIRLQLDKYRRQRTGGAAWR
jgi:hypothetical protein